MKILSLLPYLACLLVIAGSCLKIMHVDGAELTIYLVLAMFFLAMGWRVRTQKHQH